MRSVGKGIRSTVALAIIFIATGLTFQSSASASPPVTVTFVQNNGSSTPVTASEAFASPGPQPLTLFQNLSPTFSYPGHSFDYWSTQPGGGGTTYADGATYPFLNDVTLYAQWISPTHTVSFVENANQNDLAEDFQVSNAPVPLTLFQSLTPSFLNANFTFQGWNTSPDGSGTNYADGAVFNFSSALTLYAQWSPNTETVSFSPNTGTGSIASITGAYGSTVSLPTGATLTKPGFSMTGWNTMPDGSGTEYQPGATLTMSIGETLYAQWAATVAAATYVVSFAVSGLTTQIAPASVLPGSSLNLPSPSDLQNPGNTFVGWFTAPSGGQLVGVGGSPFTPTQSITLYAQWTQAAATYVVSFAVSGLTTQIAPASVSSGGSLNLPSPSDLQNPGNTFVGWFTAPTGGQLVGVGGSPFTPTQSITLYAQWAPHAYVVSFDVTGTNIEIAPSSVSPGSPIELPTFNLVNPGRSFAGWFTAPKGGQLVGRSGVRFWPTHSVILYAQWVSSPYVELDFSLNGGTGHIAPLKVRAGLSVRIPPGSALHRTGFTFRGWATTSHATQPTVRIGSRLLLTHHQVLYALWRPQPPATTPQVLLGSVGIFAKNSSALTSKMRDYIASLATEIDRHNRVSISLYGYATTSDGPRGAVLLSSQRAAAVKTQLILDLVKLNDVGVVVRAKGEGRLSNSVLASFRNVEIFAN